MGAGRAAEGLRADWQRQFAAVRRDLGFKYLRFHGLLNDEMGVYREDDDGRPVYYWQHIDTLFDFLLSIGVRPFVEFGFMPDALKSGDETVFFWRANVTPPRDHRRWADLIEALVRHWVDRYGLDEVRTRYFDVWNEPNLKDFWTGGFDGYVELYAATAAAVRKVSPDFRVGGPADAGGQFVEDFLRACGERGLPLDFVSTHMYGVEGHFDEFGVRGLVMFDNAHIVSDRVGEMRAHIAASKYPDAELHYTEWSSSYSQRDPVHDVYQNAAYVLNILKRCEGDAQSMSYWTFTDIFEEGGVPAGPFHGGFGLLNRDGLRKPTWYAYRFLNLLGPVELENDDDASWATTDPDTGAAQLLLWDFSFWREAQGNEVNQTWFKQRRPAAARPAARVRIAGLADGLYELQLHRTGFGVRDVFTAYDEMGQPLNPTRAQLDALRAATPDAPTETRRVRVRGGTFADTVPLHANDVVLLTLNPL